MSQLHSDLTLLKTFLSQESRWTQKCAARNDKGQPTSPLDPEACCFCLTGAINYLFGVLSGRGSSVIIALDAQTPRTLEGFNDNHTHQGVLGLIDAAIRTTKEGDNEPATD